MCSGGRGFALKDIQKYAEITQRQDFWCHNLNPNLWMPAGSDRCTVHDLGISHALFVNNTVLQVVMLCQFGICYRHVTEILQTVSNKLLGIRWFGVTGSRLPHSEWLKCCHLQGSGIPTNLRLFDQRRWIHHVHSEHWDPFNQWHSTSHPVLINTAVRTSDNGVISQKTFTTSDVQHSWHLLRLQSHFHKWFGLP
jgi:hypothetical protein